MKSCGVSQGNVLEPLQLELLLQITQDEEYYIDFKDVNITQTVNTESVSLA